MKLGKAIQSFFLSSPPDRLQVLNSHWNLTFRKSKRSTKWFDMVWRFYFEAMPLARFVSATRAKRRCSPCPKLLKLLWTDRDTIQLKQHSISSSRPQQRLTVQITHIANESYEYNEYVRNANSWVRPLGAAPSSGAVVACLNMLFNWCN